MEQDKQVRDSVTEAEYQVADKVREKLREILDGYGLNLND